MSKLSKYYHHAKFEFLHIYCIKKNNNKTKFSATFQLASPTQVAMLYSAYVNQSKHSEIFCSLKQGKPDLWSSEAEKNEAFSNSSFASELTKPLKSNTLEKLNKTVLPHCV